MSAKKTKKKTDDTAAHMLAVHDLIETQGEALPAPSIARGLPDLTAQQLEIALASLVEQEDGPVVHFDNGTIGGVFGIRERDEGTIIGYDPGDALDALRSVGISERRESAFVAATANGQAASVIAGTGEPDIGTGGAIDDPGTRYLQHVLTADEVAALHKERGVGDELIERLSLELAVAKERAGSLKKRIETTTEDGLAISKKIRDGFEYRQVPCVERRERDHVVTYRLDTDEEIERRGLTREERQGKLFDGVPA